MKRFVLIVTIVLLVAGSRLAVAQQASPAPRDRAQVLSAARDVMRQAHFTTLITISEDGQPQARVVDPSDPDADLTVWIGTNPSTRKVAQLRKNSRATLFYFDRATQSYVTLLGSASLVTDSTEKERHWQSQWAPFYPQGPRSTNLILIRFTPRTLEIVSAPHKLRNDPQTWRPVVLALK
jgi:general stress protein 26